MAFNIGMFSLAELTQSINLIPFSMDAWSIRGFLP